MWPPLANCHPTSDNCKPDLFLFVCIWSIIDLNHYIRSWCTTQGYFYTSQNDHHDKSSYHLSPYKNITLWLTIFLTVYIFSPWLIYFLTEILYFLTSTHFRYPPGPFFSGNHLFLCIYDSVSLLFYLLCVLDSTYKWNHTVFVFLCLIYFT